MKNNKGNPFHQIEYVSKDEKKELRKYIEEYNKKLERQTEIKNTICSYFKYVFFSPLAIVTGLLSLFFKLCGTISAFVMPYGFYCLYKFIIIIKENKEWSWNDTKEIRYIIAFIIFPFIAFAISLMFEKIAVFLNKNK